MVRIAAWIPAILFPLMVVLWMSRTDQNISQKDDDDEVYEVAEQVFRHLEENSDLMMRYSHFTKPHRTTTALCPECGSGTEDEFVAQDVPYNAEADEKMDLHRDAQEIHRMLEVIDSTLVLQQITLKYHLTALRDAELFENAKPFEDVRP